VRVREKKYNAPVVAMVAVDKGGGGGTECPRCHAEAQGSQTLSILILARILNRVMGQLCWAVDE
jgi:hypothetical protein